MSPSRREADCVLPYRFLRQLRASRLPSPAPTRSRRRRASPRTSSRRSGSTTRRRRPSLPAGSTRTSVSCATRLLALDEGPPLTPPPTRARLALVFPAGQIAVSITYANDFNQAFSLTGDADAFRAFFGRPYPTIVRSSALFPSHAHSPGLTSALSSHTAVLPSRTLSAIRRLLAKSPRPRFSSAFPRLPPCFAVLLCDDQGRSPAAEKSAIVPEKDESAAARDATRESASRPRMRMNVE